jgi:hypothetical protein
MSPCVQYRARRTLPWRVAAAHKHSYAHRTGLGWDGQLYTAVVRSLEPGEVYSYRVGDCQVVACRCCGRA